MSFDLQLFISAWQHVYLSNADMSPRHTLHEAGTLILLAHMTPFCKCRLCIPFSNACPRPSPSPPHGIFRNGHQLYLRKCVVLLFAREVWMQKNLEHHPIHCKAMVTRSRQEQKFGTFLVRNRAGSMGRSSVVFGISVKCLY